MKKHEPIPNEMLKIARLERCWTLAEAAEQANVSIEAYSRWEYGIQEPRLSSLRLLCDAFQKSPKELGFERITQKSHPGEEQEVLGETTERSPEEQGYSSILSGFMPQRDWAIWFGLKQAQISTMMTLWHGSMLSCDEVQIVIDQEIKTMDDELQRYQVDEQENISRRQALIAIAALPTTLLAYGVTSDSVTEDFLRQCAASITACWHLMNGKGLAAVNEVLPRLAPQLGALALRPSKHQHEAAQLATQASIIQAILSMHQLNVKARETHCKDAIRYAHISGNKQLQAAAYMYLGYTFSFCYQPRQPQKAITAFQQGLQTLGQDASLIRSDILMGMAEAHAQNGQEQEALRYIGLAQDHFPDYPENDPSYIYAECGTPTLYQWEGKMYLELVDYYTDRGYQQKASDALMQSIGATSLNDRCTNETIIYQADAARVLGEIDIYAGSLKQAAQMAIDLGSKKRYNEALQVYQRTPTTWIKESQIQLLARDIFKQLPARKAD